MSKWKIVAVNPDVMDLYAGLMSFGLGKDKYIVEHIETGERRIVLANNEREVGEKIQSGDFEREEERDPERTEQAYSTSTEHSRGYHGYLLGRTLPASGGCLIAALAILFGIILFHFIVPWYYGRPIAFYAYGGLGGAVIIALIAGLCSLLEIIFKNRM